MGRGLSGFPQSWVEAPRWCFHLDKPQGMWKEGQAREGSCRPPPPSGGDWDCTSGGTTRAEWRRNGGASLTHYGLSSQGCAVEMQLGGGCLGSHSTAETQENGEDRQQVQEVPHIQHLPEAGSWLAAGGCGDSPSMLELLTTADGLGPCVCLHNTAKQAQSPGVVRTRLRDVSWGMNETPKPTCEERFQLQGFKGF